MTRFTYRHQVVRVIGASSMSWHDVVNGERLSLTPVELIAILVSRLAFPASTHNGSVRDHPPPSR
ncbi:hypothetical protein L828_3203 [Mycobacteroides abscessus MAB_030201_1061]|uniref:hypothetical protein n=1 Tax=Mycobacteroides abscessus TaxID=36809 RepID=UPI0004522568|nr:hypothetical protein [Mycobacteroides abscessus]ETZ70220.1 hypothetical protein L835_3134 [Mycobacteroides abscessus MAB_110811_1470]ETZ95313.1 hypothetical protein L828_3203 [Mycobacteroides abscessus MAB_030201_1061]